MEVEKMAAGGTASKVNITIGDVYSEGVSFLKKEYTAANFAKPIGGRPRDVAMGIHSLVSEVVGMMAAHIAKASGIQHVIYCGGACENQILCETLERCMELYSLIPIFVDNPGFGTCFGAAARFAAAKSTQTA
jgi:pantothenate kinase